MTAGPMLERNAPLPTWFGIGGTADALARPATLDELEPLLGDDPLILGEGANLLVDDAGVDRLVVSLAQGEFKKIEIEGDRIIAGGGADLRRVIVQSMNAGLRGLEGLAGIPASIGGAVKMNAGGKHGEIADRIARVLLASPAGLQWKSPDQLGFGYRTSRLNGAAVLRVELQLHESDAETVKRDYRQYMQEKSVSQPLAAKSAGCVFRNPTLTADIDGIGRVGERVSAGMLLDRVGAKSLSVGGATISDRHANFVTLDGSAKARDVVELMDRARELVHAAFGIELQNEIVIWKRSVS